jgi:DNA-binding response OmpR family regulator
LTEVERRLLLTLVRNAGTAVPREAIAQSLWGCSRGGSRAPDVHVAALRAKLEGLEPGAGALLAACRGLGYRLVVRPCG